MWRTYFSGGSTEKMLAYQTWRNASIKFSDPNPVVWVRERLINIKCGLGGIRFLQPRSDPKKNKCMSITLLLDV